jgi:uncharacterized lipoprotein YddW (UPF0748 family)
MAAAAPPEHRAIWANYRDILTPEQVQQTVERVAAAHLNAIYVLVWYNGGQAAYRSELAPMMQGVPEGFDPLGALVEQAHAKGIHVHAWFVNGTCGWAEKPYLLTKHPDWRLQTGEQSGEAWYDLGRPEVRQFERELMLECLRNYDVDGIHFDYIRYDGRGMCYCDTCQSEVERRYGIPPVSSADPGFPIAMQLSGNPLDRPTTAQVLAAFDNGKPAITLNRLGEGEAALLNWQATRTGREAVTAVAKTVLERFGAAGGTVYQVRNSQTTARYGLGSQENGAGWLRGLDCRVKALDETQLAQVPPKATVVFDAQYLIAPPTAEWLEQFVHDGGHALFVDGPVFAIREPALQRVLGLTGTAEYFSEFRVITAAPGQDLVPAGPPVDLEVEKRRAACWVEFWTDSVTDLVRQVYQGAKALKPQAWVSAAVFYNKESADSVCQDWYGWLREGIMDYVLPMAYTEKSDLLRAALDEWQAFDPRMERIIPGLSIYSKQGENETARDPGLVASQRELCASYQVHGNCYFSLDNLTAELQAAFAAGPYAETATPYYPPSAP